MEIAVLLAISHGHSIHTRHYSPLKPINTIQKGSIHLPPSAPVPDRGSHCADDLDLTLGDDSPKLKRMLCTDAAGRIRVSTACNWPMQSPALKSKRLPTENAHLCNQSATTNQAPLNGSEGWATTHFSGRTAPLFARAFRSSSARSRKALFVLIMRSSCCSLQKDT